jgi:hypothetical protein
MKIRRYHHRGLWILPRHHCTYGWAALRAGFALDAYDLFILHIPLLFCKTSAHLIHANPRWHLEHTGRAPPSPERLWKREYYSSSTSSIPAAALILEEADDEDRLESRGRGGGADDTGIPPASVSTHPKDGQARQGWRAV